MDYLILLIVIILQKINHQVLIVKLKHNLRHSNKNLLKYGEMQKIKNKVHYGRCYVVNFVDMLFFTIF